MHPAELLLIQVSPDPSDFRVFNALRLLLSSWALLLRVLSLSADLENAKIPGWVVDGSACLALLFLLLSDVKDSPRGRGVATLPLIDNSAWDRGIAELWSCGTVEPWEGLG